RSSVSPTNATLRRIDERRQTVPQARDCDVDGAGSPGRLPRPGAGGTVVGPVAAGGGVRGTCRHRVGSDADAGRTSGRAERAAARIGGGAPEERVAAVLERLRRLRVLRAAGKQRRRL